MLERDEPGHEPRRVDDAKLARVRAALESPWDEVHETRVLGRVLEASRAEGRSRRRLLLSGAGAAGLAVAAAAAVALWPAPRVSPGATEVATAVGARDTGHDDRAPADGSTVSFADGSQALLSPGARVATERQEQGLLRVRQEAGFVRYDVTEDAERTFVVACGHVEVRVLGTAFSVERVAGGVNVAVERGRVQVGDGEREVVLSRGEKISVATPEQTEPPPVKRRARLERVESIEELMARADAARQLGRMAEAAEALSELVRAHEDDPRAVSALFTLGRVERARQRYAVAAQRFEACLRKSPQGPLAEDALAEAARSWAASGRAAKAVASARRYLKEYPSGTHALRMQELLLSTHDEGPGHE